MKEFLTVFGLCLLQLTLAHKSKFIKPKKFDNNTVFDIGDVHHAGAFFSRIATANTTEDRVSHVYTMELHAGDRFEVRLYTPGHAYPDMTLLAPTVEIAAEDEFELEYVSGGEKPHQFDPWFCISIQERLSWISDDVIPANTTVIVRVTVTSADNNALRYALTVGPDHSTRMKEVVDNVIMMPRAKLWNHTFFTGGLAITITILYIAFQFVYAFATDGNWWTKDINSALLDTAMLCFSVMIVDAWMAFIAARATVESVGAAWITMHILPNGIYIFLTLFARICFNKGYYAISAIIVLAVFISSLLWGSGALMIGLIALGLSIVISLIFISMGY